MEVGDYIEWDDAEGHQTGYVEKKEGHFFHVQQDGWTIGRLIHEEDADKYRRRYFFNKVL